MTAELEEPARRLRLPLTLGMTVDKVNAHGRELRVVIQPEGMQSRQEFVYGGGRDLGVDADDGRTVFRNAADVAGAQTLRVGLGIGATQALRLRIYSSGTSVVMVIVVFGAIFLVTAIEAVFSSEREIGRRCSVRPTVTPRR
jgi:hypothetical protein